MYGVCVYRSDMHVYLHIALSKVPVCVGKMRSLLAKRDQKFGQDTSTCTIKYMYGKEFMFPMQEVCKHLNIASPSDDELMTHLSSAVAVYYNYTGNNKCLNLTVGATSDLGDVGWDFQVHHL